MLFSLSCHTLFRTLQVQSVTCYSKVHEAFFIFLGDAFVQVKKCNCSDQAHASPPVSIPASDERAQHRQSSAPIPVDDNCR
jgi:hypothetical protein